MTEGDLIRWKRVVDPDRLLGAFVDGALVGTAGAYPLRVTVPGGEVSAAGVTMVGVLPTHRRRGIFKRLMLELLSDAHAQAEPIAVLWAAEGGIYPQFGFGLGSKNARIAIESSSAAFREQREPDGVARMIAVDEARTALAPIYDRVRIETPGMLERSPEWWDAYRLDDPEHERGGGGPAYCCVIELEGRDEAYALFRLHADYEHRLHHDRLEVIEAMATSAAATRELWRFLFSMRPRRAGLRGFPSRGSSADADAGRAGAPQMHALRRALVATSGCRGGAARAIVRRCRLYRARCSGRRVRVE